MPSENHKKMSCLGPQEGGGRKSEGGGGSSICSGQGIAFRQLCDGSKAGKTFFPSVYTSMYTLLLYGVASQDIIDVAD